ncbi:MAG: hypothetical protein HN341_18635 [Verrucomicrobia bacterium]|nr:hypothetical protein [Verrucomicrobiota bacterium]
MAAWHAQGKHVDALVNSCGGAPGDSPAVDAEYTKRSPLTYLKNARGTTLHINAGIRDRIVPISHSLLAFNEVAATEDQLSEEDIRFFVERVMSRWVRWLGVGVTAVALTAGSGMSETNLSILVSTQLETDVGYELALGELRTVLEAKGYRAITRYLNKGDPLPDGNKILVGELGQEIETGGSSLNEEAYRISRVKEPTANVLKIEGDRSGGMYGLFKLAELYDLDLANPDMKTIIEAKVKELFEVVPLDGLVITATESLPRSGYKSVKPWRKYGKAGAGKERKARKK